MIPEPIWIGVGVFGMGAAAGTIQYAYSGFPVWLWFPIGLVLGVAWAWIYYEVIDDSS